MQNIPIPLLEHRKQLAACGNDLFRTCNIDFASTNDKQRQFCGAFLFGMIYAYGKAHQLTSPDIHTLGISALMDVLQYNAQQATALSFKLVHATSGGPGNTMKGIIRRGIEGHRQLTSNDSVGLRRNLLEIFEASGEPYATQSN